MLFPPALLFFLSLAPVTSGVERGWCVKILLGSYHTLNPAQKSVWQNHNPGERPWHCSALRATGQRRPQWQPKLGTVSTARMNTIIPYNLEEVVDRGRTARRPRPPPQTRASECHSSQNSNRFGARHSTRTMWSWRFGRLRLGRRPSCGWMSTLLSSKPNAPAAASWPLPTSRPSSVQEGEPWRGDLQSWVRI